MNNQDLKYHWNMLVDYTVNKAITSTGFDVGLQFIANDAYALLN